MTRRRSIPWTEPEKRVSSTSLFLGDGDIISITKDVDGKYVATVSGEPLAVASTRAQVLRNLAKVFQEQDSEAFKSQKQS